MKNLQKAIDCLKNGKVIIYPTESCYSFGCDAKNQNAVKIINRLKKRQNNTPITLMVYNLDQIKEFGIINRAAKKISQKLMPGQINLIIDQKEKSKYNYLSASGISFRIPGHNIARQICRKFGSAITTTSVNIHGEPAVYDIKIVYEKFGESVCEIINAGNLDKSIPVSTIFDTRNKKILRNGPITKSEIDEALK